MAFIDKKVPDFVVIANRTNGYLNPEAGWRTFLDSAGKTVKTRKDALTVYKNSLTRTLAQITKSGSRVIILQDIPEPSLVIGQSVASVLLASESTSGLHLSSMFSDQTVSAMERVIARQFTEVYIVNPKLALCSNTYCEIRENGKSIYQDHLHLSEFGSRKLSVLLKSALLSPLK